MLGGSNIGLTCGTLARRQALHAALVSDLYDEMKNGILATFHSQLWLRFAYVVFYYSDSTSDHILQHSVYKEVCADAIQLPPRCKENTTA